MQTDFERWFVMMSRQQQQLLPPPTPPTTVGPAVCASLLPAASPLTKANNAAPMASDNPAKAAARGLAGHGAHQSPRDNNNNVHGSNSQQCTPETAVGGTAALDVPSEVLLAAQPFLTGDAQADQDILGFYLARHEILRAGR
jgi:hypothetical protein